MTEQNEVEDDVRLVGMLHICNDVSYISVKDYVLNKKPLLLKLTALQRKVEELEKERDRLKEEERELIDISLLWFSLCGHCDLEDEDADCTCFTFHRVEEELKKWLQAKKLLNKQTGERV
jgi:hypothetical protein